MKPGLNASELMASQIGHTPSPYYCFSSNTVFCVKWQGRSAVYSIRIDVLFILSKYGRLFNGDFSNFHCILQEMDEREKKTPCVYNVIRRKTFMTEPLLLDTAFEGTRRQSRMANYSIVTSR